MKKFAIPLTAIVCVLLLLSGVFLLFHTGIIVTDHSANASFSSAQWQGRSYYEITGQYSTEKRVAKSKEGLSIYEVKGDPSHNFIEVRSFLDQTLMVAGDYTIPTEGTLSGVWYSTGPIKNQQVLEVLDEIDRQKTISFQFETSNIYHSDKHHLGELYFAYDDCPVYTNKKGYLGKVNGAWVVTTHVTTIPSTDGSSSMNHVVSCYRIPEEQASILEQYLDL
jgi:hypothetical protein